MSLVGKHKEIYTGPRNNFVRALHDSELDVLDVPYLTKIELRNQRNFNAALLLTQNG